jgi:hypothetical protein
MTKDEFEAWLSRQRADIYVWPYDVAACDCGDVNCRGWRLVAKAIVRSGRGARAATPRENELMQRVS